MSKPGKRQVVLVKAVAKRWLESVSHEEYRIKVLVGAKVFKNLANLLRSFRDGKVTIDNVPTIPDLGVEPQGDVISVWSSNREAMLKLNEWFEKQGLETSGMW